MNRLGYVIVWLFILIWNGVFGQIYDPSFQTVVTDKSDPTEAIYFDDGKYLLCGKFIRVNGNSIAGIVKFNSNGTVDDSFNIGTGPDGDVHAVVRQVDGKILVAGAFTSFNGVSRSGLIRLNVDGSVDNTFITNIKLGSSAGSSKILIAPDQKILLHASINQVDGFSLPFNSGLVRLNSDGSRDGSFTPPTGINTLLDLGVLSNGKIVLAGTFPKGIAMLNSDGTFDSNFNIGTGFNNSVRALEISSTNEIFVGGGFTQFNGSPNSYFLTLTETGSINSSYAANGKFNNDINWLSLQGNGKLLVAGNFTSYNLTTVMRLARLHTDGSLDNSLNVGNGPSYSPYYVQSSSSGDILFFISKIFTAFYNGQPVSGVVAIDASGVLNASVTANLHELDQVRVVVPQGSDKLLLSHDGTAVNGSPSKGMARVNLDGSLDNFFAGNNVVNGIVLDLLVDVNGKILIAGEITEITGSSNKGISRFLSDGQIDNSFNVGLGPNGSVWVLKQQPDGKILIGGSFTSYNGIAARSIARLNSDGSLDATFNITDGLSTNPGNTTIYDIEILSSGKILVGGEFTSFNGNTIKNLVRLNADGTFDNTFPIGEGVYLSPTGYAGKVNSIEIMLGDKILLGGSFRYVNATEITYGNTLAVLNSDGTLNNSIQYPTVPIALKIRGDGQGKYFVSYSNSLLRLTSSGDIDQTFKLSASIPYSVNDLCLIGSNLYGVGSFSNTDGYRLNTLAKFNLPAVQPASPLNLTVSSVTHKSITLFWSHDDNLETGFYIERKFENSTEYTLFATVPRNSTTWKDDLLNSNRGYHYRVRAFNSAGFSPYSNELFQKTLLFPSPESLVVKSALPNEINLEWVDNIADESGFEIYRATPNNTNFTFVVKTSANVTTYKDTNVVPDVAYFYKLRSVSSLFSSEFSPYTDEVTNPPVAPSNLSFQDVSEDEITVKWFDNSTNETGFEVYRSNSTNLNFELVHTTAIGVTTFKDVNVTVGNTYFYKVRSVNLTGASIFSGEISTLVTGLDFENIQLSIYPNPVEDSFYVINDSNWPRIFEIINSTGQRVATNKVDAQGRQLVACDQWTKGIYLLRVLDAQEVHRLIK